VKGDISVMKIYSGVVVQHWSVLAERAEFQFKEALADGANPNYTSVNPEVQTLQLEIERLNRIITEQPQKLRVKKGPINWQVCNNRNLSMMVLNEHKCPLFQPFFTIFV
jgi:hypothetical protein